jgi:hypothetical protein
MHAFGVAAWLLLAVDIDVTADPLRGVDPIATAAGSAVGAFLTTLAVGAVMVAVLPFNSERVPPFTAGVNRVNSCEEPSCYN